MLGAVQIENHANIQIIECIVGFFLQRGLSRMRNLKRLVRALCGVFDYLQALHMPELQVIAMRWMPTSVQ